VIIVAYDDSDGWYDHVMSPIVNQSAVSDDAIVEGGNCGAATAPTQGRCGYGPRQPLLVISPFAKQNYVDHSITDQASILRFIEDNWDLGRIGGESADVKAGSIENMFDFTGEKKAPRLILDPSTGVILKQQGD
jgi:phospholipase C